MKSKDRIIGVMAGTYVDTKMGMDFLKSKGLRTLALPLSENPKEQSRLQLLSKIELAKKVKEKILEAKNIGVEIIFLYCNSLSAAIDMDRVSKEEEIYIITPFTFYRKLAEQYSSIFIMAANAQACHRIETIFEENNSSIRLCSLSILSLVEEIEKGTDPGTIFIEFGLNFILEFVKVNRMEALLLGCTHFPYIEDTLIKNTDIEIINPAEGMYNELTKLISKS